MDGPHSPSSNNQAFTKACFGNEDHVIQQFSNSLDLLVFRLKAKELIHTALYQCRLLK